MGIEKEIHQDNEGALSNYIQACSYNNSDGCRLASELFYKISKNENAPQNKQAEFLAQSFQYSLKGCELNNADSCYSVGLAYFNCLNFESQLILSGSKKTRNKCPNLEKENQALNQNESSNELAEKFFLKACDLGHSYSCSDLALIHLHGLAGKTKNAEVATKFLKRALNTNINNVNGIKLFAELVQDIDFKHPSILRGLCDNNVTAACREAGLAKTHHEMPIYDSNMSKTGFYYELNDKQDDEFEIRLADLKKACFLGDGWSCRIAGLIYNDEKYKNNGEDEDKSKSFPFFSRGSSLNDAISCHSLAELHSEGIYRDKIKRDFYLTKACHMGYTQACDKLAE